MFQTAFGYCVGILLPKVQSKLDAAITTPIGGCSLSRRGAVQVVALLSCLCPWTMHTERRAGSLQLRVGWS